MINQPNSLQTTTQKYLELYDITNDVLILQDGAVSMVLHSTAINFDLYSEEEQDAAIYAYAALLNSLSFPIEIMIRSQKKDVTSYLDLLKEAEIKAYNPVNKKNIRDYRQFVEELVQERNVLEKKFYIVITYTAIEAGLISGSIFIPGMSKKKTQTVLDKTTILEKALTNLMPRKEHLIHQFARIGLSLRQLKTQELIQLFYSIYNPETTKGIRVGSSTDYATPLVQAAIPPVDVVRSKLGLEETQNTTPTSPAPSIPPPTEATSETLPPPPLPPSMSSPVSSKQQAKEDSPSQNHEVPPITLLHTQDQAIAETVKEDSFTISTDLQPPTPPDQLAGAPTQ